jgi:hypothetical protein
MLPVLFVELLCNQVLSPDIVNFVCSCERGYYVNRTSTRFQSFIYGRTRSLNWSIVLHFVPNNSHVSSKDSE